MDKTELLRKLIESCPQKKLACSDARRLAEDLGIEARELGELCNEAGIKIFACELGCF
ncbi:MAG TPA: hypothetical protein VN426_08045 [Syntrophomonadaceae bacterium]|nr:hypothetical protein [Syntrophomonadaceae bacterium]